MTRLAFALTACIACLAVVAPNLVAKPTAPASGEYRGKAKSSVEPDLHDKPPVYFTYQAGKTKKFEAAMPFACGANGIRDRFDYPFGGKVGKVGAPNGKFKAVEQGSVEIATQVGEDTVYGTASVKAVFQGKVAGKRASGTYVITSADGSGCAGNGTWTAKLYE